MNFNFTDRVRKVLALAREEAIRHQRWDIGTEHLLLGLLREGEGVAAAALTILGIDWEQLQDRIEQRVERGTGAIAVGELPYTVRAKKALELAAAESKAMDHPYLGTEHLLLGLLKEGNGVAATVLGEFGVTLDAVRAEVRRLLGWEPPASGGTQPGSDWSWIAGKEGAALPGEAELDMLVGMLRPAVLAASLLGFTREELRAAVERAIRDVLPGGEDPAPD